MKKTFVPIILLLSVFCAMAEAQPATTIALVSGNNQSAQINTALAAPFVVLVTDAGSNPVSGVSVTFAIATTPGGATGQSLTTITTTTDLSGQASTTLTLGNKVGSYTVTATSTGLAGSPVTFSATATTGPATTIALTSGNNQGGQISTVLASPFVVTVTDAGGNPVTGTSVTFAIATTPGGATGQSLNTTTTTTNGSGQASSTLTLGNKVGTYTVTATSTGLSGSPVTFTATATTGAATSISLTFGNNQSAQINTSLGTPFVVTVMDAGSNPVAGVGVTFAIATTPGGATGQSLSTTTTSTNGSGQASSTLTLGNKVGSYTVTATSTGLSGSPVTFTATATTGPATTITLTSGNSQSAQISTALPAPFIVTVTDAGGNPVTGTSVTFAIATTPVGATGQSLNTTTTTTNGIGQASSTLTLGNKVGSYTVTATSGSLSGSPVTFSATATTGSAATIALTSGNNQSAQISTALAAPFIVTVTDAGGNPVTGTSVTFAIATTPVGATGQSLNTTTTTTNGSGQASSTLTLGNKAGAYTVTATSGSLSGSPVTFTATAATGGATTIAVASGNSQSGQISTALAAPFVVLVTDAGSNPVSGVSVTFAIATTPAGATGQVLSTLTTTTDINGHASSTLTLGNKVGTYTVTATSTGLTGSPLTFTATATTGPATTITLTSGNNQSGAISTALAAPFVVTVTDAGGNPVTGTSVTFAIATIPAGATGQVLSTTATTTNVSGQASSTLTLGNKVGTYTVTATSTGLTGSPLTFTATASGSVLTHFTVEQAGGGAIGPQTATFSFNVRVVARDAGENIVTTYTGAGNTVNITSNGTLTQGGGTTGVFTNGVLDPWPVTISNTGTDSITATRTSGGTEKGTSNAFTVVSGPVNNFLVENFGGGAIPQQTAGVAFNIRITARDAGNNTVTGFTGTASLTSNAGLVGSPVTTGSFVAGVLASQSVTVTLAGAANRTITATRSGGSETGTSAAFTVVAGAPAAIAVSAGDNQSAGVGAVFGTPLAALVSDAYANPVSGATVTFSSPAAGATGTWPGAVHSVTAVTVASGIATAPAFTASTTAGSYVDTAKVAGAGIPALFHMTNTAAAATKLTILTQPSATDTAGIVFSAQPVIRVEDAGGNLVTTFAGTVTATRVTGTGALQGQVTVNVVSGLATFSNLSYNVAETITVQFTSSPVLTVANTGNIVVRPNVPAGVFFVQQPSTATAGVAIAPAVTTVIRDAFANPIATAGIPVTMTISTGTGALSGTLTQNTNASGVSTFADLSINLSGSKNLTASSGTLTSAISSAFTINPAAANRVAFVQEPTNANAGATITPAVTVQLKDPFGNDATTPVSSVTLALLTGTGPLNGTLTQTTSAAGLATFANLSVTTAGAKTIRASSGALTADTSATFTITALGPSKLVFVQQPTNAAAGAAIIPAVTVQVQDTLGNNLALNGVVVIMSKTGSGNLTGNLIQTTSSGLATFASLSVDTAGLKTLIASSGGLTSATSLPFTISAGAASKLAFTTQPGGAAAGALLTPQPAVTLQDQFGNAVTATAQNVTIAISNNAGPGGILSGTLTVAVNTGTGIATFAGLTIDKAGAGYTLTATGSTVSTTPGVVVSNPFSIVPGAASKVQVETLADGTGVVLPAQNVSSGTGIAVYSIARDQFNNFIRDTVATWSLINRTGGVAAADLVPSADRRSATFTGAVTGTAQISATVGALTAVPSGTLTVVVATAPTKIRVETAANGTGVVLPDSAIASGKTITVYAIARDNANNFVRNVVANWGFATRTGGVVGSDLSPLTGKSTVFTGHVIGTATIQADSASLTPTPSGTISVGPGVPATVTATAGSPQSTLIGTPFATNLQVTVTDSSANLVGAGVQVKFSAPAAGPSGTFAGGVNTVLTNAGGVATAPVFTANTAAGTYNDTARVAAVSVPALFVLTNSPGGASSLTPVAGTTPQHAAFPNSFSIRLAVLVKDSVGNKVPGINVTFTPPTTTSSGSFSGANVIPSDTGGIATATVYSPNRFSGPDTVTATAAGVKTPARFILTNDPGQAQNMVVTRGLYDTALVKTAFKDSLQVSVSDGVNPVPGLWVTFTAPASGASVLFSRTGKTVDSALTNAQGLATSSQFSADSVSGDFHINATTPSINGGATFFITNKPGPVTKFAIETAPGGGPIGPQLATIPFDVLITSRDVYNNPSSFPTLVNISITSNGPLLQGGGTVAFNGGLTQTIAFQNAGASDTLKVVRVGGAEKGASNAFIVNNPIPTVTSVSPPNGRKGQTIPVLINGTGFISGASSPSFGTTNIQSLSWVVIGPTQLSDTILIKNTTTDGAYAVSVSNIAPGGGTGTLQGGFIVGNTPAPKILSLSPDTVSRLQAQNVIVRGQNFYPGVSSVSWGAGIVNNATTVDSADQMTSNITPQAAAATGLRDVIVVNTVPAGTGGGTDTLKGVFFVKNPIPTLYSISQATGFLSSATTLTLQGSNFIAGVSQVSFTVSGVADTGIVVSTNVDSALQITVNLTIKPTAKLGVHTVTVTNAAPGGGKASLVNSFTIIYPTPSLTTLFPNAGNRRDTLDLIITGKNFVAGVSKVLIVPNDLKINSTRVDSVTLITTNITIPVTAILGQHLVSVYNGSDTSGTLAFTVNLTGPAIPVLLAPPDNSQYQPTTVALRWGTSQGATGYRAQLSTVATFLTVKLDTSLSDTTLLVKQLTVNTRYYWRVASTNSTSSSSFSAPRSFVAAYPGTIAIFDSVTFPVHSGPTEYKSADWRLIGLPGAGTLSSTGATVPTPVANYLPGTPHSDWDMAWDNGNVDTAASLVMYSPGPTFTFTTGRGYWLIKRSTWIVRDTVASSPLDANGIANIPLHTGWNIITNPFKDTVTWSSIAANNLGMDPAHKIYSYMGNYDGTSTVMAPYLGYYFDNTDNMFVLRVPFKGGSPAPKVAAAGSAGSWTVGIDLYAAGSVERVSNLGVAPGAKTGRDSLDYHRPRLMRGIPATLFNRPEWDPLNSAFATDIRPLFKDAETWEFEVRTTLRIPVQLGFRDVASIPGGFQAYLIDVDRAHPADLRASSVYAFTPATDVSKFKVVIGTAEAVRGQLDALVPKAFALENNFPNPFNPETTIPVSVPFSSEIHLTVYNILGAEIRTLYAGQIAGGKYWFKWDGRSDHGNTVASGVYFVRLVTSTGLAFVHKLSLVR